MILREEGGGSIELLNKMKVLNSFLKISEQWGEYFFQIFIDKFL
jgi:hypothetical protein